MASDESVTRWLGELQAGNQSVAQKLWDGYFRCLVGLARARLCNPPRRAVADKEDVVPSAFASSCRGAEADRFPELHHRDNPWQILVTLTVRKAQRPARDEQCQKSGDGRVRGEAALRGRAAADESDGGMVQMIDRGPTPASVAEIADECERLLAALDSAELRSIAMWKMDGETNEEIAARRGWALSTVERRLSLIRRIWSKEGVG